jgi:hypothetical protein
MSINFPDTPFVGLTYSYGNSVWEWNGSSWVLYASNVRLPENFTSIPNNFTATQAFTAGITSTTLETTSQLVKATMVPWRTDNAVLGTTIGSIHIGNASTTSNAGGAITFGGRDSANPSSLAAAGIYVNSDGSYGTKFRFATTNSYVNGSITQMTLDHAGNLGVGVLNPTSTVHISGTFSKGSPVSKTSNFTLAAGENYVIWANTGAAGVVTLPAANTCPGREILFKTIAARALTSASANVLPLTSNTAGTAILAAVAGNWALLVSNGTNWVIMAAR